MSILCYPHSWGRDSLCTFVPDGDAVTKLSSLIEKAETASVKPDAVTVVPPKKDAVEKPAKQTPSNPAPKQRDPVPPPPAVAKPPKPPIDTSAIVAGIQSGDSSQVGRGLMNAVKLTQADKELSAAVIKVLQESTTVTHRILAARALERWGQSDALPALEQATKDKSGMLKGHAQRAITAINARKSAQP